MACTPIHPPLSNVPQEFKLRTYHQPPSMQTNVTKIPEKPRSNVRPAKTPHEAQLTCSLMAAYYGLEFKAPEPALAYLVNKWCISLRWDLLVAFSLPLLDISSSIPCKPSSQSSPTTAPDSQISFPQKSLTSPVRLLALLLCLVYLFPSLPFSLRWIHFCIHRPFLEAAQ